MASEEIRVTGTLPVSRKSLCALVTLATMVLMSQLLENYQDYEDRKTTRNQLAEMAAQRVALTEAPVTDWFTYISVNPKEDTTYLSERSKITVQSSFSTQKEALTIHHEDVLRCTPLDPANGTEERYISAVSASLTYSRTITAGKGAPPSPGAKRISGEWDYSGDLPDYDADCTLTSNPCIWLAYGIKKCQYGIVSSPVKIRLAREG